MANYSLADIKALRETTGAGMMDVKKALEEAEGDSAKALEIIRDLTTAVDFAHAVRDLVDRMQTLLPLERQLDRVRALRAEGGDRGLLQGLPDEPLDRLAGLEAERVTACSRLAALDGELGQCDATLRAFDDRSRAVLARRSEIAQALARAAACGSDRARARDLEREIASVEARLDAASAPLLSNPWRDQEEELARVPVAVLEDRGASHEPADARGRTVDVVGCHRNVLDRHSPPVSIQARRDGRVELVVDAHVLGPVGDNARY